MPFDGAEVSETTERLVIGRARIEAGWCQGHMQRNRWTLHGRCPEYCLIGAVRVDLPGWSLGACDMAADLLLAAINRSWGGGWTQTSEFNDSPGRTKAQVLEVLDVAIAMSRGEYLP
jgi:hypothetical protein